MPQAPPALCLEECGTPGDDVCDDGGSDFYFGTAAVGGLGGTKSVSNDCPLGTDCLDCGPRPVVLCVDTCEGGNGKEAYVSDNLCDDGGENSVYSLCGFGTDCADCGPRLVTHPPPSPLRFPPPPLPLPTPSPAVPAVQAAPAVPNAPGSGQTMASSGNLTA